MPLGNAYGKEHAIFSDAEVRFNGHIESAQFAGSFSGIPWPDAAAQGLAGQARCSTTVVGNWFAGNLLAERTADEDGNGSYETFYVPRVYEPREYETQENGLYFSFCKTAYRPYDLNVQVCLIAFNHWFGDRFHITSDGTNAQWNEARQACQCLLGYGSDFQLAE